MILALLTRTKNRIVDYVHGRLPLGPPVYWYAIIRNGPSYDVIRSKRPMRVRWGRITRELSTGSVDSYKTPNEIENDLEECWAFALGRELDKIIYETRGQWDRPKEP